MDVAIIGAGNVGGALAHAATRAGHAVTITASGDERAVRVAAETGASRAESNEEAANAGSVVILAVPGQTLEEIADELSAALGGKTVVDVTNRFDMEDAGNTIDGTSNAERLQAWLPEANVVKAFNTVLASRQADPVVDGVELDGFVAGDDDDAKGAVLELVQSIGLRPIDVGSLRMARALEALGALNISLNMRHGWSWQNGWKLVGPTG